MQKIRAPRSCDPSDEALVLPSMARFKDCLPNTYSVITLTSIENLASCLNMVVCQM